MQSKGENSKQAEPSAWTRPCILDTATAAKAQAHKDFVSGIEAPIYIDGNGVTHFQGPAS